MIGSAAQHQAGEDEPVVGDVLPDEAEDPHRHRLVLRAAHVEQRREEVVPDEDRVEDQDGARDRPQQREDDLRERLEVRCAVDRGRVVVVATAARG